MTTTTPTTTNLRWSEALALQHPQLDETHEEFVDLLVGLQVLLDNGADPLPHFAALLAHTVQHFAMEERWMAATGFAPENCHSRQHAMVLDVMRQVQVHALSQPGPDALQPMRELLPELMHWFPAHAEMMDAALVHHMAQLGYDTQSGQMHGTQPYTPISSCGSAGCA